MRKTWGHSFTKFWNTLKCCEIQNCKIQRDWKVLGEKIVWRQISDSSTTGWLFAAPASVQSSLIKRYLGTRSWRLICCFGVFRFDLGNQLLTARRCKNGKHKAWYQSLTRVSISRKSREEMTHIFLSRAGESCFHFSFSSWFSRCLRKISLSLLDWWDSETQISCFSRFSRCWEKILFLFSIYEIFENNSLSLLNFQDF